MLEEKNIRRWVRRILQEERPQTLLKEDLGQEWFMKTFVDPFSDVFQVALVSAKQLLSAASYNVAVLFHLSANKMAQLRGNYEQRKQQLDSELNEVMGRIKSATNTDGNILAFMFSPALFLTNVGAVKTGEAASTLWKDLGLRDAASIIPGIGPGGPPGKGGGGDTGGGEGILGGLLGDLNKLFFVAHHAPTGDVILEAEGEDEEPKPGKATAVFEDELEKSGVSEYLSEASESMVKAKGEQINNTLEMLTGVMKSLSEIAKASTIAEVEQIANRAKQDGIELDPAAMSKFKQNILAAQEKILSDPDARKELEDASVNEATGTDEGKIPVAAEKLAVTASMKGLEKIRDDIKQKAIEDIEEPGLKGWVDVVNESPQGKQFIDLIIEAKSKIEAL